jgi:hypothetical protein
MQWVIAYSKGGGSSTVEADRLIVQSGKGASYVFKGSGGKVIAAVPVDAVRSVLPHTPESGETSS